MTVEGPSGTERVIALYGAPVEWWCRYDVQTGGIDYWHRVAANRSAEVVVALLRESGCFLLHTKEHYPAGVYRLLTGGVLPGEDLLQAVAREGYEETGLHLNVERYLGVIHNRFVSGGGVTDLDSHVLLAVSEDKKPASRDGAEGIAGYREVPVSGLLTVARELEGLDPAWVDWGRFRATAHRLVFEAITGRSSFGG